METSQMNQEADVLLEHLRGRDPHEKLSHQAIAEVLRSVYPIYINNDTFVLNNILERIVEPDRVISFKVTWEDDNHCHQVNRGYRVQFNSALGPYKGGLRFHPSVNLDTLKFLGFEQVLKNALTGLWLGGGKGGSDFDPKGKSDNEVRRFCQSFMIELSHHIGPHKDIPAGDIGVGPREIGYLFGQYKRATRRNDAGTITGKDPEWGGSAIRPEATGYGLVYFAREMIHQQTFGGKSIAISGSGNVAQFAAKKMCDLGGKVVTLSDSNGTIYDPDGINEEKLTFVMKLKNVRRERIKEYAEYFDKAIYFEDQRPWKIDNAKFDIALPCATQNELDEEDAQSLIAGGIECVAEGANMPCTPEAVELFSKHKIMYGPGKAANAGGVAVSGLEMTQDHEMKRWTHDEVDEELIKIMKQIHSSCVEYGMEEDNFVNYVKGANVAGFQRVAQAMVQQQI
jgi:glutamate dehydrogenase (NADP+)